MKKLHLQPQKCETFNKIWRGARVVMEQIANLSARKGRLGSSPSLSARFLFKWN